MHYLSTQAGSARSSTPPSNAGNATFMGFTFTPRPSTSTRSMSVDPHQPSASGDTLPMSQKRKIFSVTEMTNTADFDKTDNAKVPAKRQNTCGAINMETDEDMADDPPFIETDDSWLYGFSSC